MKTLKVLLSGVWLIGLLTVGGCFAVDGLTPSGPAATGAHAGAIAPGPASVSTPSQAPDATKALLPRPFTAAPQLGVFQLDPKMTVSVSDAGLGGEADKLASDLRQATGFKVPVEPKGGAAAVRLVLDPKLARLGREGYRLTVRADGIEITAPEAAGVFYGGRSLLQLARAGAKEGGAIPCVAIEDCPRFRWRGLMIDCARTFQSLDYLRKTVDRMATYKMNRLHLHLTDDQAWRLEIDRYPKLTGEGAHWEAKFGQPAEFQGFYSRKEMREFVEYARQRHVEVVPEIDMPGHSTAALACFPSLSCTGRPLEISPAFVITDNIFCPGNPETFEFLRNVLDQVADMFPFEFVHIGGDEVPKGPWLACPKCQALMKREGLKNVNELQSYFIRRAGEILAKRGRRLIGWDEILDGGIAPGAAVMSWHGMNGGIEAARAGHDVVMSPMNPLYFNYNYGNSEQIYAFEPVPPQLARGEADHVLGVEACFWAHTFRRPEQVDRQLYPRLLSLAERAWSRQEFRDWREFKPRLEAQLPYLGETGVDIRSLGF